MSTSQAQLLRTGQLPEVEQKLNQARLLVAEAMEELDWRDEDTPEDAASTGRLCGRLNVVLEILAEFGPVGGTKCLNI